MRKAENSQSQDGEPTNAEQPQTQPPAGNTGLEIAIGAGVAALPLVMATELAGEADSFKKLGPPSMHWSEETLDPDDEKRIRGKSDNRAWVHPDKRNQSLKSSSDSIFFAIKDFFKKQAEKMKKAFGSRPEPKKKADIPKAVNDALNHYDWSEWQDGMGPNLAHHIEEACTDGATDIGDALGPHRPQDYHNVHSYAKEYGMRRAAELVGKYVMPDGTVVEAKRPKMWIDETTRRHLKNWLNDQLNIGKNWTEIANSLYNQAGEIGFPYMSDWRARTIARSEASMAYNRGVVAGLHDAGIDKVEVIDGTGDDICAPVNHKIWTLEEAEANPLGHPNCSRHFLGVLE